MSFGFQIVYIILNPFTFSAVSAAYQTVRNLRTRREGTHKGGSTAPAQLFDVIIQVLELAESYECLEVPYCASGVQPGTAELCVMVSVFIVSLSSILIQLQLAGFLEICNLSLRIHVSSARGGT
jgi:hypothetical protein